MPCPGYTAPNHVPCLHCTHFCLIYLLMSCFFFFFAPFFFLSCIFVQAPAMSQERHLRENLKSEISSRRRLAWLALLDRLLTLLPGCCFPACVCIAPASPQPPSYKLGSPPVHTCIHTYTIHNTLSSHLIFSHLWVYIPLLKFLFQKFVFPFLFPFLALWICPAFLMPCETHGWVWRQCGRGSGRRTGLGLPAQG